MAEAPDILSTLRDQREILRTLEGTALAGVAQTLVEVCEVQAELLKEARAARYEEWMTPEQAADLLGRQGKSFEQLAPHLPKRYLSPRVVRYPRSLLDAALMAADTPERALTVVSDQQSIDSNRANEGSSGVRSFENALKKGR